MNRCSQCGVDILDDAKVCPLCHCTLKIEKEQKSRYPSIHIRQRKLAVALRIYLAAAIVVEAVVIYLNIRMKSEILWSVIVGAALFIAYYVMRMVISNRGGYRARTYSVTLYSCMYVILIDACLGYTGWSVNYVLPSCVVLLNIAVISLIFINRENWQSYIVTQISLVGCSLALLILKLCHIVTAPYVVESVLAITIATLMVMIIVGDRKARQELKRRFHVRR